MRRHAPCSVVQTTLDGNYRKRLDDKEEKASAVFFCRQYDPQLTCMTEKDSRPNLVRHDLCRVGPGEANASGTRKYVPSRRPTRIRLPFCVVRIPEERVRCSYWTVDTGLWWAGSSASEYGKPSRMARLVPPYEFRAQQDCSRPLFPFPESCNSIWKLCPHRRKTPRAKLTRHQCHITIDP